ncbi:MAG: hypothetical protein WAW06_05335 [bacterium]
MLRAEARYNWINFLVFLAMIPLVQAGEARYGTGYASLLGYLLLLLMVNGWNLRYIREKRDYQYAQLPVAARTAAGARILMVVLSCTVFVLWSIGIRIAFTPRVHADIRWPLTFWGLIVIVYSLAFMFRDRFVGSKALMRGKIALVALLGGLLVANVLTMISMNRARAQGTEPPGIVKVFEFIERNNPTTSSANMTVWLVAAAGLACLTLVTYSRRRSHW